MKLLLIGDFSPAMDEGLKNIAHYSASELSKTNTVARFNIKKLCSVENIRCLASFRPDVIHYFTGPTLASLILLKIIGLRWRRAKKVVSALHPDSSRLLSTSRIFRKMSGILKPDLILVQDSGIKEFFESIGYRTRFLFNGVNTRKFSPVSHGEKLALRKKMGIDEDKFVLLHVGHLSKVRNIQAFEKLTSEKSQVLIVGSTYMGVDEALCQSLTRKGCKILKGYHPNINEIYALSDCYVFPVEKTNSIFMPLSVLEAMSCNLPVITTRFDGLTSAFIQGGGMFFEDEPGRYPEIISRVINDHGQIRTRDAVMKFSWENIAEEMVKCYASLDAAART